MVSHFGHTNCQTVKHSEPKFVQSLSAPDFAQTGVYKVTPSSSQSSPVVCSYIVQSAQHHIHHLQASYLCKCAGSALTELVSRTQKLFSIFS